MSIKRVSPVWIALIGVLVAVIDLLRRGGFDPFVTLTIFAMAGFEFLFRRQRRFPSIVLSLIAAIAFMLAFRTYGLDLKIMRTDSLAPRVPKNARLVIQKSLWQLAPGDLAIFQRDSDSKNYVGVVKSEHSDSTYDLVTSTGKAENINRKHLKGKIILVLPTNGGLK